MKLFLSCSALLALAAAPSLYALNMAHSHNVHKAKTSQAHAGSKGTSAKSASVTRHTAAAHAAAHVAGHAATKTASTAAAGRAAGQAPHGRVRRASLASRRHHTVYERFTAASFVTTAQGDGDLTAGEDPTIRAAAIDALGNMHGTAVVINPANGRVLAMVNQKMALSPGAEPCSTIKLSVGLAALSEGLVTRDTMVNLGGFRMNMTEALAHSNNLYFEEMGRELGFERVRHYATQFGLGELAGYNISGEQLGTYPDHELPAAQEIGRAHV